MGEAHLRVSCALVWETVGVIIQIGHCSCLLQGTVMGILMGQTFGVLVLNNKQTMATSADVCTLQAVLRPKGWFKLVVRYDKLHTAGGLAGSLACRPRAA